MTKFDEAFSAVTAGLELEAPVVALNELPLVWRDGEPFRLNAFEGANLRSELMDAYAIAAHDIHELGWHVAGKEAEAGEKVADSLEQVLNTQASGVDPGDTIAVQGAGLFDIPDIDNNTSQHAILPPHHTLFGELQGIAYGEYSFADAEKVRQFMNSNAEVLPIYHRLGALLCLGQAKLCHTAESGGPAGDDVFDIALLPIHIDFRVYKAYPAV